MEWILLLALFAVFGGGTYVEKSQRPSAVRIRNSRPYQGARRRTLDTLSAVRGRPVVYANGQRTTIEALSARQTQQSRPRTPSTVRRSAEPLSYTPPVNGAPPASPTAAPAVSGGSGGMSVDFFAAILQVVAAPYEGPVDALRQLRILAEGGRTWDQGLIRLHQRMADPGDMRIDPFVNEHVLKAAAFAQAMVLELSEADAAMTALLNMTLTELTERGLQVPNTR